MFTFRPLPIWPYPPTANRRSRYTFRAPWSDTVEMLKYEVDRLGGSAAIIAAGFSEGDIRKTDGLPRADARVPSHPGVEVSFDTPMGRLVYGTDVVEDWQGNVRSIALGLEALRAVDRFGISRKGEQYAGWLALPGPEGAAVDRGRRLVETHGGIVPALKATHPDHGGDQQAFQDVQAYRRTTNDPSG